jgi:hypothetical protein
MFNSYVAHFMLTYVTVAIEPFRRNFDLVPSGRTKEIQLFRAFRIFI